MRWGEARIARTLVLLDGLLEANKLDGNHAEYGHTLLVPASLVMQLRAVLAGDVDA